MLHSLLFHPHTPEIPFPLFLTPLCSRRLLNFSVFPCLLASSLVWSMRSTGNQMVEEKQDQVFIPSSLQAEMPRVSRVPLSETSVRGQTPAGNHAFPFPFQPWHGKSTPRGPVSALLFSLIPAPIFVNACFLLNSPQITHSKCLIFFLTNTQVNQKSYTKSSMGSDK